MKMNNLEAVNLILSDARGFYIPRDFLTDNYNEIDEKHCKAWGLTDQNKEQWMDCADPENEWYWDAWDWILNNAKFVDENGNVYRLWQDGNLWGYCYELMTAEEKKNLFGECENDNDELVEGEKRKLLLFADLYIVEKDNGDYVLTDGYETDYLNLVNVPPVKFQTEGTFNLIQKHIDMIANFIDGME